MECNEDGMLCKRCSRVPRGCPLFVYDAVTLDVNELYRMPTLVMPPCEQ